MFRDQLGTEPVRLSNIGSFWTNEMLFAELHPVAWRSVHSHVSRKWYAKLDLPVLASETLRCLIAWHEKQKNCVQRLPRQESYEQLKRVCITIAKRKVFRAIEKASRKKRTTEQEISLNGLEQSIEDLAPSPSQLTAFNEQIDVMLKTLQEREQLLFEYIYAGCSNREISDAMEVPIRQIQRRRKNLVSILRDSFQLKTERWESNQEPRTKNQEPRTKNQEPRTFKLEGRMVESARKESFFMTSLNLFKALFFWCCNRIVCPSN
jgi:RNA polymerase sigma factor (sigma-70 family)